MPIINGIHCFDKYIIVVNKITTIVIYCMCACKLVITNVILGAKRLLRCTAYLYSMISSLQILMSNLACRHTRLSTNHFPLHHTTGMKALASHFKYIFSSGKNTNARVTPSKSVVFLNLVIKYVMFSDYFV